jgi:hypothetical protein
MRYRFIPEIPTADSRVGEDREKLFDDRPRQLSTVRLPSRTAIDVEDVHTTCSSGFTKPVTVSTTLFGVRESVLAIVASTNHHRY